MVVAWMEALKICMKGEEGVGHLGLVLRYKVITSFGLQAVVVNGSWWEYAYVVTTGIYRTSDVDALSGIGHH